jgi:NAD(P)-dependent dehydrogenase (short-subunit alcohol dehydrogenase family)
MNDCVQSLFSLEGQTALVTGGTGVLGGAMAVGLARAGAKVAVLGRRRAKADEMVAQITAAGGQGLAVPADVMDRAQLEAARDTVLSAWGKLDILVNAAGGTKPEATIPPDKTVFDLSFSAMRDIIDLNLIGTVLPSLVFGEGMAKAGQGSIVNISSMNAQRALTRSIAYAAGKAAIDNFTKSLAVELALKFGEGLRVNAIAPGFFLGEQNRALLVNPDGTRTARGEKIIAHTPAGRFGEPDDLVGALIFLCSPASRFVTGTVQFVDGGVSAFMGI